jgi:glycosyltransferase involved in cell wall biosynthesis
MRIVLLTGIWPPDVGGPATHGPELAAFLAARGHRPRVVTMADGDVPEHPYLVESVSRSLAFPARYPLVAAKAARAARAADVVYASGTYAAAAAASVAARRPLVVKLVSDPAYERAVRWGIFQGTFEDFQRGRGGGAVETLKALRTRALCRARSVVIPSAYLAEFARGWGLDPGRIVILPNPAPDVVPSDAERAERTFVFAGRLTRQKALGIAIDAIARVEGGRLVLIGAGPERAELERHAARLDGRVAFRGALPREQVLHELSRATAVVLSSEWENLPHAAVEALALGVPVVASAVGGVPEVVRDGENGLLVRPGDVAGLADALGRLADDTAFRDRLAAAAAPSVAGLSRDRVYGRIEMLLVEAAG